MCSLRCVQRILFSDYDYKDKRANANVRVKISYSTLMSLNNNSVTIKT